MGVIVSDDNETALLERAYRIVRLAYGPDWRLELSTETDDGVPMWKARVYNGVAFEGTTARDALEGLIGAMTDRVRDQARSCRECAEKNEALLREIEGEK